MKPHGLISISHTDLILFKTLNTIEVFVVAVIGGVFGHNNRLIS